MISKAKAIAALEELKGDSTGVIAATIEDCQKVIGDLLEDRQDDLISRKKTVRDLRGIQDVLATQGDPFLAGVLNRAISCVENQPVAHATEGKRIESTYDQ